MSERSEESQNASSVEDGRDDRSSQGPNLVLVYSLIALALATAIGLAVMIVLPFYQRR